MSKTQFMIDHLFGTKIMHPRAVVRIETCVPEQRFDLGLGHNLFIDQELVYSLAISAILERDIYQCSRAMMRANDFLKGFTK